MNIRKFRLACYDTAMIVALYLFAIIMSHFHIDSLVLSGEFTVIKLLLLIVCLMTTRAVSGLYARIWRYANVSIYLVMIISDIFGGFIFFIIGKFFNEVYLGFSYTMLFVMSVNMVTLLSRFVYQYLYALVEKRRDSDNAFYISDKKNKINVAIVGAGNIGVMLARELIRNPKSHYYPYCFIEKKKDLIGNSISGIKIYAEDDNIIERIKNMPVHEIIIALPDSNLEERKRLYDFYKQTDCKVKLYDYPLGNDSLVTNAKRTLREFKIEDLLFRKPLEINGEETREYYFEKTILVTGGGGSIGSELCRQIAKLQPKKLVILDIYENNAYEIQQELLRNYGDKICLETIIASVRDVKRLDEVFRTVRPDIVFHAAAHKHVPLMEKSGCEAIKNNVIGTYNTANMAEKYGVKKFLLISTDKAVNPTNIMGASKRLCEMVIQCRTNSKTEFTAVRFGNVLGSNGSVIPLFKKQIENGGPITLTDKRIIRYFMTIPEAVQLVLETGAMAHNGELFVLDMGKPVKIIDLAENMIELSGLRPYEDIDIIEIGLRPGEKLYEELLMKNEKLGKTPNEMIFIEYDMPLGREEVENKIEVLLDAVNKENNSAIIEAIKMTVPTYRSPDEINSKSDESKEMQTVRNNIAATV